MIKSAAQILAEIGEEEPPKPNVGRPLVVPCKKTGRTTLIKNYPVERKPRALGNRKCEKVPGCDKKHRALGFCTGHYDEFRKYGKIRGHRVSVDLGDLEL